MWWEIVGLSASSYLFLYPALYKTPTIPKRKEEEKVSKTSPSSLSSLSPVCEPTKTQAILLFLYFLAVRFIHGESPSLSSSLLYLFFAFFCVCLSAGADAGNMSGKFPWQFRVSAFLRTPVLCFIVVPLSFILSASRFVRIKWKARRKLNPALHEERVKRVVEQVAQWDKEGRKNKMRTARPNWAAMSTKLGSNKGDSHLISLSHLDNILHVDTEKMELTAEPMVTMGDITNFLLPSSLSLLCQVEMESLTIGGLSLGIGIETNSHNIGLFQETVVEYQIVTSHSPPRVLTINKEREKEIFYSLPHSVGTLGFLVSVTVKIVKTKPYVRMHYFMTHSTDELSEIMMELSGQEKKSKREGEEKRERERRKPPQFLEATAFSKDCAVVQTGEFCDAPQTKEEKRKVNYINLWYKPFYFRHLESLLLSGEREYEELIPLSHYYHRFSRSIFWEIEHMIPFSSHPLYRTLWNWLGPPEVSLLKLFQGPVIRHSSVYAHVVQESCFPLQYLKKSIAKYEEWWKIYPLLIFPFRIYDREELTGFLRTKKQYLVQKESTKDNKETSMTEEEEEEEEEEDTPPWGMWVDLGAYGIPDQVKQGQVFEAKRVVREFEKWTRSIDGFQFYYTDLFCTRKEYREMFDHTLWEKARGKLNADDAFPEPYDKVKSEPGIVDLAEEEERERQTEKQKQN